MGTDCGKVEYTCNSAHRYGKEYCTPHTIHESQLDELILSEVRVFGMDVLQESERYDKIVKDWAKKRPLYDKQIQQLTEQITSLKQQVEDLIIERIGDREHA